jgi:hypothetical protein
MLEDFKKDYNNFKEAVLDIKKILGIEKNSFRSWKGIYKLYMKHNNPFFKSKKDEYIFYLTKLEGKQRNKLLGLNHKHYEDKKVAKSWYHSIANHIHPDKGGNNEAFNTLHKIYEILIEEEDL